MKKASFALIIGLFLLAYSYAFAQVAATTQNHGLISGNVIDTGPLKPNVPGATVTAQSDVLLDAGGRTTVTDMAGNYQILNLPPGEYVVSVSKPGYDDSTDHVTVVPGGQTSLVFWLYRADTLVPYKTDTPVTHKTDTLVTYYWKVYPVKWPFVFLLFPVLFAAVHMIKGIRGLGTSESKIGEAFMSRVREALQNDDVPGAISICNEAGGLANVLKAGLMRYAELSGEGRGAGEGIKRVIWRESVREAMEKAGVAAKRELKSHWSFSAMFGAIGGTLLLCGFHGAGAGTVKAYAAIAALKGTMAGVIAEALMRIWVLLIIALACAGLCLIVFIIYIVFERKADALISRTQRTFAEMVNSLFVD